MRKLLRLIAWLALLLLLALLVLFLFLTTQGGTATLGQLVDKLSPSITLKNVSGSVLRDLHVEEISWKDAEQSVTINNVILKSDITDLSDGIFHIQQFTSDALTINLAENSQNNQEEAQPLELPIDIKVDNFEIKKLIINQGNERQEVDGIYLKGHTKKQHVTLDQFTASPIVDGKPLTLQINGELDLQTTQSLATQLNLNVKHDDLGIAKGYFNVEGQIDDYQIDGAIDYQSEVYSQGSVKLVGKGGQTQLQIDSATLNTSEGVLKAKGHVAWKDQPKWELQVNTENLNLEQWLADVPAIFSADLDTRGQLQDGQAFGTIQLDRLDGVAMEHPLKATGVIELKGNKAVLDRLNLQALQGSSQLSGEVDWQGHLKWDVKLNTQEVQTKSLLPEWDAVLTTDLQTSGEQAEGKIKADIQLNQLTGTLQGYPLKGKGRIQVMDKQVNVDQLNLQSGDNHLLLNGQLTSPFNATWKLEGKNLKQLYPDVAGSLDAEGYLKGSIEKPEIQADLKGKKLRYQDNKLASIVLDVRQQGERYSVKGALKRLEFSDQAIRSADIDGEGTLDNHRIRLNLNHQQAKASLDAKGGWKNEQWKGSLSRLELDDTEMGDWKMTRPISLVASEKSVNVTEACFSQVPASVCSTLQWRAEGQTQVKGQIQHFSLEKLKSYLPNTVQANGMIEADYDLAIRGESIKGDFHVRLPDNQVTIRLDEQTTETLHYKNTYFQGDIKNQTISTMLNSLIDNRGHVKGEVRVTLNNEKVERSRINGDITLNMPDIAWVNAFVPDIQKLAGQLNSHIRIDGALDKPQVMGDVNLQNTQFTLPETNTKIHAVNLNVQANSPDKAMIKGTLKSGQGNLSINGHVQLDQLPKMPLHVQLKGSQLDFMNTHEIQGKVSPDLTISGDTQNVKVSGSLVIPETHIELKTLPATAIGESDDVILVGSSSKVAAREQEAPVKITPNVHVILGKDVTFEGFGLDASLTGKLHVFQVDGETFAEGSLTITNGEYKAYGQALTIESGRLVFNGPLDNPGMDIKAIRDLSSTDNGEVGIQLSGTLQNPQSRVFSDPVMSQSEALSYLLTGRSLNQASDDQSTMLLSALTGLGISGGESIAQTIGGELGLDSVTINTEDGFDASELELGKRLGPKLYLKYIVGIFDRLQHVAVEYQINRHLKLQAQSGTDQGFDLIYEIDTN